MSITMEELRKNMSPDVQIEGSFGGGDAAVAGTEDGFTRVTFPDDKPPLEHDEQARLAKWAWGLGLLLYANANGQYRKGERPEAGLMPGILDLFLAEQCGGYGGMYIEMKRDGRQNEKRGGKLTGGLSDEQADVILRLREAGYYVAICYGYDEGRAAIERYRSGIVTRPIAK